MPVRVDGDAVELDVSMSRDAVLALARAKGGGSYSRLFASCLAVAANLLSCGEGSHIRITRYGGRPAESHTDRLDLSTLEGYLPNADAPSFPLILSLPSEGKKVLAQLAGRVRTDDAVSAEIAAVTWCVDNGTAALAAVRSGQVVHLVDSYDHAIPVPTTAWHASHAAQRDTALQRLQRVQRSVQTLVGGHGRQASAGIPAPYAALVRADGTVGPLARPAYGR